MEMIVIVVVDGNDSREKIKKNKVIHIPVVGCWDE
jgi:hypothetical protein